MFKSHFARPPAKCDTAFHEVRPCTPCETNLARQGKRGWAVRFHGLLHPTQALGHTHRTVRPALQVQVVRRACTFPVSRYGLITLTCQRRMPDTTLAVELPAPCPQDPNRRTGTQWGCFRNNRGCLAYDTIAFRACTMRHVYLSRSVKKGWKRRENREFCLKESRVEGRRFLHTCKSWVARESLSGTAQHAGAALPVRVTIHSCDPSPEPAPLRHGTTRA